MLKRSGTLCALVSYKSQRSSVEAAIEYSKKGNRDGSVLKHV